MDHLEILSESFDEYFKGELKTSETWIINPFSFNLNNVSDYEVLKKYYLKLRTNRVLEMQF